MILYEMFEQSQELTLVDALRDFLPLAIRELGIQTVPKIKLARNLHDTHVPTFGRFENDNEIITVDIENRHPVDILRTLAHELVHYAQGTRGMLDADSWQTGSPEEDEANAEAGVIMRKFNTDFPQYLKLKPVIIGQQVDEEWSEKYKRSINCNNPKGFSQRAHCQGRKKANEETCDTHTSPSGVKTNMCPDDDDYEINYGSHRAAKVNENFTQVDSLVTEWSDQLEENLRKWFKEKWVRFGPDGKIRGSCARGSSSEGKPKCLPQSKAHALGKKGRAASAAKKRREDPNPERRGAAKNVATKVREEQLDEKCWKGYHKEGNKKMFGKTVPNCVKNEEKILCPECGGHMYPDSMINEKKDACYYKVKSRYKVWPSAYASGALVQCRKKGAANWGKKSESVEESKHCDVKNAVPELKAALVKRKTELKNASAKTAYDKIDKIMSRIAQTYNISGQELHDLWTKRYGEIPDTWVLDENFADSVEIVHEPSRNGHYIEAQIDGREVGRVWFNPTEGGYKASMAWVSKDLRRQGIARKMYQYARDTLGLDIVPSDVQSDDARAFWATNPVEENFADGKKPGRKGLAKRVGVDCKQSVSKLRSIAKNSSGEKQRMAHWCANMKSGRNK